MAETIHAETLYKTDTPEDAPLPVGEYYEICLASENNCGQTAYFVKEIHGWWDGKNERNVDGRWTLSPEEGFLTYEEAEDRYSQQVLHRAKEGFMHSFSPCPPIISDKPYYHRLIVIS